MLAKGPGKVVFGVFPDYRLAEILVAYTEREDMSALVVHPIR